MALRDSLRGAVLVLTAVAVPLQAQSSGSAVETARAAIRIKEFARAVAVLRPAAVASDSQAQYLLASLLRVGLGSTADPPAARELLLAAANRGHAEAQYSLAASYANDDPRDLHEARRWLERAAAAGHPLARAAMDRNALPLQFIPSQDLDDALARRAAFWSAVQSNDVATVEALGGRDLIDATDEFGRGALARAAEAGATNAIDVLLASGARVEAADAHGISPLMLAVAHADVTAVDRLLRAGANADASDRDGNTVLMYASAREMPDEAVVARLLSTVTKPLAINVQGWSALDWARAAEATRVIEMLRESGIPSRATVAVRSDTPGVPLRHAQPDADLYRLWSDPQIAASRSNPALFESVRAAAPTNPIPADALRAAVVAESGALPKVLTAIALEPRQAAATLRWGIQHAPPATVKLLLDRGIGLQPGAAAERAPLIVAVQAKRAEMVELLLEAGAEVNVVDAHEQTALMLAAGSDQSTIVSALLAHLARVDAKDTLGRTALWYAAAAGGESSVKALLDARSAVDSADRSGQTPLSIAAGNGHTRVVASLLAAGADHSSGTAVGTTALMLAARNGDIATLKLLLDRRPAVDAQNRHGDTALIQAARNGHADAVKMLLASGASVKLRNADRMSALDVAAALGLRDIEEVLAKS